MTTTQQERIDRVYAPPTRWVAAWTTTDMPDGDAGGAWTPRPFREARQLLADELARNIGLWAGHDDVCRVQYGLILARIRAHDEPAGPGFVWSLPFHELTLLRVERDTR